MFFIFVKFSSQITDGQLKTPTTEPPTLSNILLHEANERHRKCLNITKFSQTHSFRRVASTGKEKYIKCQLRASETLKLNISLMSSCMSWQVLTEQTNGFKLLCS